MKPEFFLAARWLFTRDELRGALELRGKRSRVTVDSHLARWRRAGRVLRVKEGLYIRVDPERGGAVAMPDLLAVASKMCPDAVLAYHTALEAQGFAASAFERLTFLTRTKMKPVRFSGREFAPVRPRAALIRAGMAAAWTEVIERRGIEVRVTTPERTVADVLDRPDLAGGLEEAWRSCMLAPALDLRRLEAYVVLLRRRTLAAKVGFLLERRAEDLAVPLPLLERLRRLAPKGPVYADRRAKGRLASGWNLLVPESWLEASSEGFPWSRGEESRRSRAQSGSARRSSRRS